MPRALVAFAIDRAGHFAMMSAILTPVALMAAAFAVDVGAIHLEKRRAQALTDLAAVTAAASPADPVAAALGVFRDNGVVDVVIGHVRGDGEGQGEIEASPDQLFVEHGTYTADTGRAVSDRFVPASSGGNAVRVIYRTKGPRYFGGAFFEAPEIVTQATASADAAAAFSIGSRLAALDGGVANAILGGLTGSTVSLSVMDYDALLSADVELFAFLQALALDLDVEAGTFQEVLDAELTASDVAHALAGMDQLDGITKSALDRLGRRMGAGTFRLADIIDVGGRGTALAAGTLQQIGAEIGVMELIAASLVTANGTNQIALDLGVAVPGLLDVSANLAIGEPPQHSPWFRVGTGGELVRTAQTRLRLVAEIGGLGGLLGARIRVPLYLELAHAEARLADISCPTGRRDGVRVTVDARPGVANLYLAEVNPAPIGGFASPVPRKPAVLVKVPLVEISAQAQVEIGNMTARSLTFTAADIAAGRIKQVSTNQVAGSLVGSLFSSLDLDIDVVGLGLGLPSGLSKGVGQALGAAAPALDRVLNGVLSALGLRIGEADVRVHGATCGRAVLVQ